MRLVKKRVQKGEVVCGRSMYADSQAWTFFLELMLVMEIFCNKVVDLSSASGALY